MERSDIGSRKALFKDQVKCVSVTNCGHELIVAISQSQSSTNHCSAAGQLSGRLKIVCSAEPNFVGQFYMLSL